MRSFTVGPTLLDSLFSSSFFRRFLFFSLSVCCQFAHLFQLFFFTHSSRFFFSSPLSLCLSLASKFVAFLCVSVCQWLWVCVLVAREKYTRFLVDSNHFVCLSRCDIFFPSSFPTVCCSAAHFCFICFHFSQEHHKYNSEYFPEAHSTLTFCNFVGRRNSPVIISLALLPSRRSTFCVIFFLFRTSYRKDWKKRKMLVVDSNVIRFQHKHTV